MERHATRSERRSIFGFISAIAVGLIVGVGRTGIAWLHGLLAVR